MATMTTSTTQTCTKLLDAALEYLERGWSIIPVRVSGQGKKIPHIRWKEFQTRQATPEEVEAWFTQWPDAGIALVTGAISGIYIVDCDTIEAQREADRIGLQTFIKTRTQRGKEGCHLYFEHPGDGKLRGNKVGVNADGVSWPKIDGLDFRGDGGYALLPPSKGYEWDIPVGISPDDMAIWTDPQITASVVDINTREEFDLSSLDLSSVSAKNHIPEWDKTYQFVRDKFPTTLKIPSGCGNGRNDRVMRHISDSIIRGFWGDELRAKGRSFMREFFEEPLPEPEFLATVASMEAAERRNHPERLERHEKPTQPTSDIVLLTENDADRLIGEASSRAYIVEPWLWPESITQIHGYSGSGKSMFLQHILYAAATGQDRFGPYLLGRRARVLYLDFEMGRGTIGSRLKTLEGMYGPSEGYYQVWAPFSDEDMDLKKPGGLSRLDTVIKAANPEIVVIDTNRSAFVGLEENSAEGWSYVNRVLLRLRDMGLAVISVHHSNKPGESGLGREAGSTGQLAILDTQIRVAQVYEDETTAKQNAGIWDASYSTPVFPAMSRSLSEDYDLQMVMELRYRKVREWTEHHEWGQWVGFGVNHQDESRMVVGSRSPRQKAQALASQGTPLKEIAKTLHKPLKAVKEWVG